MSYHLFSIGLIWILAMARSDELEDTELAKRIKSGDQEAYRTFFEAHYPALFRFLRHRGLQKESAEDIIQNAFLYIWEKRQHIEPGKSLRAYLFRIGYTRMLNHFRDRKEPADMPPEELEQQGNDGPMAQLLADDLNRTIQAALAKMAEKRRVVFELCFMQQLTYREAAEALGVARKTVENHMALALKEIRRATEHHRG